MKNLLLTIIKDVQNKCANFKPDKTNEFGDIDGEMVYDCANYLKYENTEDIKCMARGKSVCRICQRWMIN